MPAPKGFVGFARLREGDNKRPVPSIIVVGLHKRCLLAGGLPP